MKSKDLSFLVIGAGAVGGITAALLKKNGYDVEVLCHDEEYASLISDSGLNISGICGNHSVRIPSYCSASKIEPGKDVILHATKATDMAEALKEALPLLSDSGYVVSMQNGICEEELASIAGPERIIGCVTGWGATMKSKGNLKMTSTGDFIIGYPDRSSDDFLENIAEALSVIVPVKITDNILGHLYSKLIINSCITSLGAICGLYLGDMLKIAKVRRIFIEIIREAVVVGDNIGIKIEVFGGKLDFKKFIGGKGFLSDLKRHAMIRIIGFKYRRLKSSSLQSLERNRKTEIDYLNGYIVNKALNLNFEVPVNKAVTDMIHEIELHKREITPDNFNDPVFVRFN
jgi:2-dehydropantoate 2-reductase